MGGAARRCERKRRAWRVCGAHSSLSAMSLPMSAGIVPVMLFLNRFLRARAAAGRAGRDLGLQAPVRRWMPRGRRGARRRARARRRRWARVQLFKIRERGKLGRDCAGEAVLVQRPAGAWRRRGAWRCDRPPNLCGAAGCVAPRAARPVGARARRRRRRARAQILQARELAELDRDRAAEGVFLHLPARARGAAGRAGVMWVRRPLWGGGCAAAAARPVAASTAGGRGRTGSSDSPRTGKRARSGSCR